jgi:DNA-binding transcriptional LysR family regulator
MGFTLIQLRHFVAAAETGRVSRAAELCNIAQPSLSTSLQNLEALVGAALFKRQSSGLSLTVEGERFLRHARRILDLVVEATEDVQTTHTLEAGEIRIAVTETISGFLVPSLVRHLSQSLPAMHIHVVELERKAAEKQLLAGQVDLSILLVSHLSRNPSIAYDILVRSPRQLWTCLNHPLLEKPTISLEDVSHYDFVLLDMDEHASRIQTYWDACKFSPKIVYRSTSLECIRSLVGQGYGVTILSDFVYRAWSHDGGRIGRRPLIDQVPTMDIGVAYNADREPSPRTRRVIQLAKQLLTISGNHPAGFQFRS